MKLCVPVTDVFHSRKDALLPLVAAVSFKSLGNERFPGKAHFLECSLNVADLDFAAKAMAAGLLAALESGDYESFACDIGPNRPTVRGYSENGFPRALPVGDPLSDEEYFERAARNVRWLRSRFSGRIQVENLNYFPTGGYERVCEPDFVCRLIEEADVDLLLDIPHAMISAHHLGYRHPREYFRQLPLERVFEVQISHPGELAGVIEDLHEPPTEQELAIISELVRAGLGARYLTVEYYRDADVLCDVYRRLAERLSRDGGAEEQKDG